MHTSTDFFIACEKGDVEKVRTILLESRNYHWFEKIRCNLNEHHIVKLKDKRGTHTRTPFLIACEQGQDVVVELLLNDERIDVAETAKAGKSRLDLAHTGKTGLHLAVEIWDKDCREVIKKLLASSRFDINAGDNLGRTPLSILCYEASDFPRECNRVYLQLLLNDPRIMVNKPIEKNRRLFEMQSRSPLITDPRTEVNYLNDKGTTFFYELCLNACKSNLNDQNNSVALYAYFRVAFFLEINFLRPQNYGLINADIDIILNVLAPGLQDELVRQSLSSKALFDVMNRTLHQIRPKIKKELAVEVFLWIVLFSDEFFKLSTINTNSPAYRFFSIAARLPMELQMMLCLRLAGVSTQTEIYGKEISHTLPFMVRAIENVLETELPLQPDENLTFDNLLRNIS